MAYRRFKGRLAKRKPRSTYARRLAVQTVEPKIEVPSHTRFGLILSIKTRVLRTSWVALLLIVEYTKRGRLTYRCLRFYVEILLEYSRRFSIEEMFKDLKEVCGLGSQEVRKWESCKAHMTITAMGGVDVEIETWERNASELNALQPRWDDAKRRPSHKNKRDWIARKIAFENFSRNIIGAKPEDIQKEILRLASLLGLAV